jgi:hypothetical protein
VKPGLTDEVVALVGGVDPSTWEDVRAAEERDAVVAPNQEHFERTFTSQENDRRGGNGSGDTHRFVYIAVALFVLVRVREAAK